MIEKVILRGKTPWSTGNEDVKRATDGDKGLK